MTTGRAALACHRSHVHNPNKKPVLVATSSPLIFLLSRVTAAQAGSAIFSSVKKSERHQLAPKAKPHGTRPPSVQRWRRKQTIPKSANIMHACGMRGPRWQGDASLSTFLT